MVRRGRCQNSGKTLMPADAANLAQVEFTPEFKCNLRQLAKKYRHLQADVQPVIAQLESVRPQEPNYQERAIRSSKCVSKLGYSEGEAVGIPHDLLPQNSKDGAVDGHLFQNGTGGMSRRSKFPGLLRNMNSNRQHDENYSLSRRPC
jgi:hypothetical protein